MSSASRSREPLAKFSEVVGLKQNGPILVFKGPTELSCSCQPSSKNPEAPMKLTLRQQITQFAHVLQNQLFPSLEEELGELSGSAKRLATVLEQIPLARFVPSSRGWIGRP